MIKSALKFLINSISKGNRPSFLIVGAQKAGTTSLHYLLNSHPQLIGSKRKEIGFFSRDENYAKGQTWYHKHFLHNGDITRRHLFFESTPEYLYRSFVANRIFNYNPKLKIVMVLREPVARAYSAWNMYHDFSKERSAIPSGILNAYLQGQDNNIYKEFYTGTFPSFEQAIEREMKEMQRPGPHEEPGILRRGIYLPQVKRYCDLFGRENVLIVGSGDLNTKTQETLDSVVSFLEVAKVNWVLPVKTNRHARTYTIALKEETKASLGDFYRPYNEELFLYLGKKLNW